MNQTAAARVASLLKLAKSRFGDELTEAEKVLFEQTAKGEAANYGEGDPAEADQWGPDRVLQADRIRWLCTDTKAVKHVLPHQGIEIIGARVEGQLRLSHAEIGFPLAIGHSAIPAGIEMLLARLNTLSLESTHTGPIRGDSLRVDHGLYMWKGFRANGEVSLARANIGEDVSWSGGCVCGADGRAIVADGIEVKGSIFLGDGFKAEGEVRLLGATTGGDLDCSGGHFSNPGGAALTADGIEVNSDVFLRGGFKAEGDVRLLGAKIGGDLDCSGGHFSNPTRGTDIFWHLDSSRGRS